MSAIRSSAFDDAEIAYLTGGGRRLGRLATVDAAGQPHVVPVGFRYNPDLDTIDVGGHHLTETRKYRNVAGHNTKVAFVVDDVRPGAGWSPRAVQVRGEAEAVPIHTGQQALIRITPTTVVSWGLDGEGA